MAKRYNHSRARNGRPRYNHQHVFLWLALSLVALGVIVIAVYLMTGGRRSESQAEFASHTFTEDFTADTYKDAASTTADWDTTGEQTSGEALLYHGAWTNIQDLSIKGPQFIPGFSKSGEISLVNVEIGPDDQPYIVFDVTKDEPPAGITPNDYSYLWYTHWNPNFYGTGKGEWVKVDGTKGADRITPTSGPFVFVGTSGGYRSALEFDSNNLPIVGYWARVFGHSVETYVSRWCAPAPGTVSGATIFGAWGNLSCTSANPSQASVDPYSSCLEGMALDSLDRVHITYDYCSSGTPPVQAGHYTRWNGTTWTKLDGVPGVDDFDATASSALYGTGVAIDSSDQVYIGLFETFISPPSARYIAYKATPSGWRGLDGSMTPTVLTSAASGFSRSISINPVTNLVHFVYQSQTSGLFVNKVWNGTEFINFAGQPGLDSFSMPANDYIVERWAGQMVFDPSEDRGAPQLLTLNLSAGDSHFLRWDGSAMRPHPKKAAPEVIPRAGTSLLSKPLHMAVNSHGTPFVVTGRDTSDTVDPAIMRYTPEWSDTSKNHLQSTTVDNVDDAIVAATLSWTGESRGFGGTAGPAAAVPFGATGRNQLTDVDCSLSNNGGLDFFPVEYGKEFTFPTVGSNLIWACDLDSGTKLDNPTLFDLKLDYKTTKVAAGLQIIKNTDTDGDGVFTDNGQAVSPGQEITYQLKVVNTGTTAAQNVIVKDPVPAGTSYVLGSTKVNGVSVADLGGTSPLEQGVNVGAVPAGTLLQYNWQDGGGQDQLVDINKFSSQQFTDYGQLEELKAQTGPVLLDGRFVSAGQSRQLDDGSAFLLDGSLDGALVLNDGRLFSSWYSAADKNIYGRFFDKAGNALGPQLLLSAASPVDPNERPSAAQLSGGDIVVIWNKNGSSGPTSQIIMRRFDSQGAPQTGEIVLADEPGTHYPAAPFVHTDWKSSPGGKPPKNPLAVDQANNFYVGLVRVDSSGCQSAAVAGFDAAGSALFSEVNLSGLACDVSQAPDILINANNKLAAIYPRRTSTDKRIELVMLNLSGSILSGPHSVYVTPGLIGFFKLAQSAALPVDSNPDRFVFSFGLGSTNQAYLQIVDETGTSLKGPVAIGSASEMAALKVADPEGFIFTLQNMTTGQPRVKKFDQSLNQDGGYIDLPTAAGSARTQTLAIDQAGKFLWANWQEGSSHYFGNLLNFGAPEHSLISSVYDAGNTTKYSDLAVTQDTPAGTNISYQARVGEVASPDGTWTAWTDLTPGVPFSLEGRYLQYKVKLDNSADPAITPILHDIVILQKGSVTVEYKVKVNQAGGVLSNTGNAVAGNVPNTVTASNQAQNPILPATSSRSGGEDRIDTSVILSGQLYPSAQSAGAICLVRSDDPVDALPGSPFCSQVNAPILLTPTHALDNRTLAEIQRVLNPANKIYLLGREKALGPEVRAALSVAGYTNQEQIGGRERRDTSRLIADKLISFIPGTVTRAGVANAYTAADALSLSAPAALLKPGSTRFPVLLTANNELNQPVKEFFNEHPKITTVFSAGGDKVIGVKVLDYIKNLPQKPALVSFKGKNRFETTALVAAHFFPIPAQIFAMSGIAFPARTPGGVPIDALLAGPLAAQKQAPLIYVVKNPPLPPEISSYLTDHRGKIGLIRVIGGTAAVSDEIQQEMLQILK